MNKNVSLLLQWAIGMLMLLMSLGIAFKGSEGIVFAVDSRVTLNTHTKRPDGSTLISPSTFDNATKLLNVGSQTHVGAITYGLGAIGMHEPRTAHSFMPEFEAEIAQGGRLKVQDFARQLGAFFLRQWKTAKMPDNLGEDMIFLVGGYDLDEPYGKIFELGIPSRPEPIERIPVKNFGALWGGQRNITDRLMTGFDGQAIAIIKETLGSVSDEKISAMDQNLKLQLQAKIPWQFLPLQDCIDLSIFLVRATIMLQGWATDHRGVGGAIDVAIITRTEGFKTVQQKQIRGETS